MIWKLVASATDGDVQRQWAKHVIAVNWWLVGDGKFVVFLLNQCVRAFTVKAAEYKIIYHEFCFIVFANCNVHLATRLSNDFKWAPAHIKHEPVPSGIYEQQRSDFLCQQTNEIFFYFISNFWYLNQQIENLLQNVHEINRGVKFTWVSFRKWKYLECALNLTLNLAYIEI
jgi:hypothetical protein